MQAGQHSHIPSYSRRAMLQMTARVAAITTGAALLTACGESTPGATPSPAPPTVATTATATAIATRPAATPATAPPATAPPVTALPATVSASAAGSGATDGKIAGGSPDVPDAWTKLPPPYQSVRAVPGKGGKTTAFMVGYMPPVPPRTQNAYWQELERRLGVTFEPTISPADSYAEKVAAVTASGDFADLMFLQIQIAPVLWNSVKQGAYTDLTPYLTGNALKEYPNLARFADYLWKNVAVNGKIYGVPRPLTRISGPMHWRKDWGEKVGIPQPKSADDFANLMVAFTEKDPDGNGKRDSYGMGALAQTPFSINFFRNVFRVPNEWRKNANGTLTNAIETDEFAQAITYMRRLYDAGVFHPDILTMGRTQRHDYLVGGKIGCAGDALTSFAGPGGYRDDARKINPAANVTILVPPGHDGGKATFDLQPGFPGLTAIPAKVGKDKERVAELLRILDYFAAPFGSEEQVFLTYGIKGTHYDLSPDGTPILNNRGKAEIGDLNLINNGMASYYYSIPGDAQEVQQASRALSEIGQENPAQNVYSPTQTTKAGELNQLQIDRVSALVSGRTPLSALDQYVKDWRSRGGDQIRKEYEDALRTS